MCLHANVPVSFFSREIIYEAMEIWGAIFEFRAWDFWLQVFGGTGTLVRSRDLSEFEYVLNPSRFYRKSFTFVLYHVVF